MTEPVGVSYYSLALSAPSHVAAVGPLNVPDHRVYLLRRLHSLSGVVPVGVFLVEHLWTNSKALQGGEAFTSAVNDIQALPYLPLIEIFGIFLPLAFHSFYGLYLAAQGRQNTLQYSYPRNWLYLMQRLTGVMAFVFIMYHLGEFRLQKWIHGMRVEAFYQTLEAHLSSTWHGIPATAILYLVGIAVTVFHFSNGLSGFLLTWGLTVSRTAQRRAAIACGVLGLALFALGANTVIYFATGSRFSIPNDLAGAPSVVLPAAPDTH